MITLDWNLVSAVCAVFVAVIGCTWALQASMNRQFSATRTLVYSEVNRLLAKLEYHEEHDDKRFTEMKNDLWLIRLRAAAKDKNLEDASGVKED